jgi:hypothetical protein
MPPEDKSIQYKIGDILCLGGEILLVVDISISYSRKKVKIRNIKNKMTDWYQTSFVRSFPSIVIIISS